MFLQKYQKINKCVKSKKATIATITYLHNHKAYKQIQLQIIKTKAHAKYNCQPHCVKCTRMRDPYSGAYSDPYFDRYFPAFSQILRRVYFYPQENENFFLYN